MFSPTWPPPARAAGEVQAWLVALPLDVEPALAELSAAERERAGRFAFAPDRRRFVWSRLALRALLGPVELALEPRGKPYVAGGPGFSLAHAGAWALVAIADGPVGCDLEPPRDLPDLPGMARLVMAPAELEAWQQLAGDARVRAFYRAWTRKEALLKARGDGFLAEPRGAEVGVEPGAVREVVLDGVPWALRDLRPGAPGLAAVAVPAGPSLVVRTLSLPAGLLS